jgi:CheY-like chemotaxis protein
MDGEVAVELARAERPDLILLDIDLPRIDGYEVARRLRALPDFERTRIVALSGFAQESDRIRSRAAGMDEHLAKPLSGAKLREVLAWVAAGD